MADPASLRVRRARHHKAGDHSLCKRCAAVRGELPAGEPVTDPKAEMRQLAGSLALAYRADTGNALLARELRMTLQALIGGGGNPADDELDDLFAELRA